ncbi:MAG: DUF4342 domain-containing protein [Cyanomargarita calcarea GSE-NOS-MK-12-04C]|uniref:DUF4342 domain-containing protein n=1 Tax=Cyanomargarita calcarea GSE-NOS-MK-12-04C TaxID=2839659 RepID=A0A951QK33_9CYAN|nr:DUF4342 domain-containing protein [Cyanomargarita calcarea GSE-NOS-MK-12-04C]
MHEPVDSINIPVANNEEVVSRKVRVEELSIGSDLVADLKELMHQVNIRRLVVKNDDGYTLLDIPLSAGLAGGVAGVVFFPVISAIGGIGATFTHLLITRLKVIIEREE